MMHLVFFFVFLIQNEDNLTKQSYLEEVNRIRMEGCTCGDKYFGPTTKVVWNETLEKTAIAHSIDMKTNNYFSHISKNGETPADRLKKNNYNYSSYAENIFSASGYTPTTKAVVLAWKNSPSHCENIMNTMVTEMGVGIYKGYYTQLFGSRYAN